MVNGHYRLTVELADASSGYEAAFFSELFDLEAQNFWFRSRNQLIIWALQHYFPSAKNFLEIGCGTGYVLSGLETAFPHLKLSGSELFSEGLAFAAQRLSTVELLQMDARNMPFREEFDVIGSFDVLEHIADDIAVLEAIYNAARPQGGVILTVPQHAWLWSHADTYAHHVRRYSAQDLITKLNQLNFKVLRVTSFVSLLLPLMMASRRLQQRPNPNYTVMSELKISRSMNFVLETVLNLERAMIQRGISFPLGGSLLVVAQKL